MRVDVSRSQYLTLEFGEDTVTLQNRSNGNTELWKKNNDVMTGIRIGNDAYEFVKEVKIAS